MRNNLLLLLGVICAFGADRMPEYLGYWSIAGALIVAVALGNYLSQVSQGRRQKAVLKKAVLEKTGKLNTPQMKVQTAPETVALVQTVDSTLVLQASYVSKRSASDVADQEVLRFARYMFDDAAIRSEEIQQIRLISARIAQVQEDMLAQDDFSWRTPHKGLRSNKFHNSLRAGPRKPISRFAELSDYCPT